MSAPVSRFVPRPTPESQAYWDACNEERFVLERCATCRRWQFYPRGFCAACGSDDVRFEPASGRGTVKSFAVMRIPVTAAYQAELPFAIVLVALEEGPTMMSRMVGGDPEAVAIGDAVEVSFEAWDGDQRLPVFRSRSEAE